MLSFKNERYGTIFPKAFIGWGFWNDTEFDFKTTNTNNPFYFKVSNMACVTFALEKKLKKIYIFNEFNLPLIGIYAGTEYSSLLPYFAIEGDEKETNPLSMFDILFISQNTQLQNRFNIDFKIKSKTIRVQYALGYKKLHLNNNAVHSASHIFKIGYLFNKTPYVHK